MAKKKATRRTQKLAPQKKAVATKKRTAARPVQVAPGPTPPAVTARIQENNRERRVIERAIDSSREKTLSTYRTQLRRFAARTEGAAKTVFAEGDSWFNYPLGAAVIDQLQGLINTPIANFAWPGAETRQLLALHERKEIEKRLTNGPERGKKWDVLLFSGGGDDIVGDQMVFFLNRYDPHHPNNSILNDRFNEVLDLVMAAYADLVSLRDALSPNTLIVGHSYDYAWATGKGACWLGPWLKPSLDYVGVPPGDAQHAVVAEMLDRFEARLSDVAARAGNFVLAHTHGTLRAPTEWANELHPKNPGFNQIAHRFKDVLQQRFGRNI